MKFDNLLYYSTNTYLAYLVNQNFYNGNHYVWCSPVFDSAVLGSYDIRRNIPSSSNPFKIYIALKNDVEGNDLHSYKIESNRRAIKSGASVMLKRGVISEHEFGIISKMVDGSSTKDFRPLIYLIPKDFVDSRLEVVAVEEKANPLSVEYRIIDLKNTEFEIIEF